MALKVNEIFYSIQGESSYAGQPCVFVRMTGCNLRCSYCDTTYAYYDGNELEISEIMDRVAFYKCPLVEITGGEPLIQNETPLLVQGLLEKGYEVLLETNGSQDISQVDKRCAKIIDIKCPSSGEEEKNDLGNLSRLTDKDEVKFVIGDRKDYDYAKKLSSGLANNTSINKLVHFSPVFGKMDPKTLATWVLEDRLDVRLQIQLHKIIWGPEQRTV